MPVKIQLFWGLFPNSGLLVPHSTTTKLSLSHNVYCWHKSPQNWTETLSWSQKHQFKAPQAVGSPKAWVLRF